jgi:type II secretory pathway pseudopilin PulG
MDLGSWLGGVWRAVRGQTVSSGPAATGGTRPPSPDGTAASGTGAASDGQLGDDQRPARNFRPIIGAVLAASLVMLALFAVQAPADRLAVFGMLVMVAAAAAAVGSLLGFLFGIPRSLQDQRGAPNPEPDADGDRHRSYAANTNLEQISDWLTKILVGVGLIQLGRAPGPLGRLVGTLAQGLGGQASDRLMVGAVLVFYPIFGFLAAYLLTRLLLQRAFSLADLAAEVTRTARETVRDEVARQQRRDADAFSLVAWQLKPPAGTGPPTQEQLDRAIRAASPSLRSQIFTLARDQRNANWRAADRSAMMRTIPVFRALIDADASFHRNHGQLGYALKDSDPPDFDGAREELDTAIRLRDQAGNKGWLYYELNRAALDIKLANERAAAGLPPDDEVRERILADLRAVAGDEQLFQQEVAKDAEIQDWLRRNAPDAADLLAESAAPTRS